VYENFGRRENPEDLGGVWAIRECKNRKRVGLGPWGVKRNKS